MPEIAEELKDGYDVTLIVVEHEAEETRDADASSSCGDSRDGVDLESGNIIQQVRKNTPLLIPVFVSTILTTNDFSLAFESKGSRATPNRTYFLRLAMSRRDAAVLAVFSWPRLWRCGWRVMAGWMASVGS